MKLDKRVFIKGYILTETGMLIGGADTGQGISGADKVVLRNPINERPYIPGSSIKGKMRSLAELLAGEFGPGIGSATGGPIRKPTTELGQKIAELFGVISDDKTELPRRLIVRDAQMLNHDFLEKQENLDLPFTEIKTEVTIDRITAKATPHSYERVPAGALFNFEIVVSSYETDGKVDSAKELVGFLFSALLLLQDDCLGASGSRGYGKVRFHIESPLKMRDRESYLSAQEMKDFDEVDVPVDLQFDSETLEQIKSQL